MPIDTKHQELQGLRIDRTERGSEGAPSPWAKRTIIAGIAVVVLLGLSALLYRLFGSSAPEVEIARATVESSGDPTAGIVLSATGYIVAHHKINVNSKVTGRVESIGVEKGDKVKQGQVLVRATAVRTLGADTLVRFDEKLNARPGLAIQIALATPANSSEPPSAAATVRASSFPSSASAG